MILYHHSRALSCRAPQGAVPCGASVRLRLMVRGGVRRVVLHLFDDADRELEMKDCGCGWYECRVTAPDAPTLWWYDFRAEGENGEVAYYGNAEDLLGGEGMQSSAPARGYQMTVYDPAYQTPEWLRSGVMYQVFPDRFYRDRQPRSAREDVYLHARWQDDPILLHGEGADDNTARDFFGGTLRGIAQKLPYLADMGVSVLYLNPIFRAQSNHRYDTGDYMQIDPLLGTAEDFTYLCAEAKRLGIRLLLDGVFSHTGENSRYFNKDGRYDALGAHQSRRSRYASWYSFKDYPDAYDCWWNFHTLPCVQKDNPDYQAFIMGERGVARRWLRQGASGWRLDVADELPMGFLRRLRSCVKAQDENAALLGEVWEEASHKVAYGQMRCYCAGDTLDSVMNYPLRDAIIAFLTYKIDARALARQIQSMQENYPKPFLYALMNLTGSHDRARIVNVLAECDFEDTPWETRGHRRLTREQRALGEARFRQMIQLLTALPGAPCVYYGDEYGMEGASDPYCRKTFDWAHCDNDLSRFVREQLRMRASRPVLQTGTLYLCAPDENTVLIERGLNAGYDVFGKMIRDEPFTLRLTRL